MAVGRPLGAKLFLEGIEVPLLGATITSTVDQASIAYVDLVPQQAINDIKPRTHVVLAVRDFNNPALNYPYVNAWEGEVYGFNFGKTVSSRSFSISCIDTTSYWDNALCYFMNTQQSLGSAGMAALPAALNYTSAKAQGFEVIPTNDGANVNYFKTVIDNALALVNNPPPTFLTAFVAVIKSITKVNDFYNFAESRLRIQDRILLNDSGLLPNLISNAQGATWFNGIIGQSGGFTSLRSVINDLLGLIFHDNVSVPFPARVTAPPLAGAKLTGTVGSKNTTLGSYLFKPNLYMSPPPMCNVFFPDEYSQFQYSRSFFKEPTRLIYSPELPFFQSGESVALPMNYQPDSLQAFMYHLDFNNPVNYVNKSDTGIASDPGHYLDEIVQGDPAEPYVASTPLVREGQFLTNEERVKGIWMARESLFPAATMFNVAASEGSNAMAYSFTQQIAHYLFYKKRFETRQLQITSHLKLSVVPGFNVLVLDDSDAQQNVVAYCSSVTHRIYATEGGYTNVSLSYARTPDEEAQASSNGSEPPIPPWYNPDIFGKITAPPASKSAPTEVANAGGLLVSTSKLSTFYQSLLGDKGYRAVTDYAQKEPTLIGAVAYLLAEYRTRRALGSEDVQQYISSLTGRDYVRVEDTMAFLGASLPKDVKLDPTTLVTFTGGAFNPKDAVNGAVTTLRQTPILAYAAALKAYRGFRG
jgi:hypothetical protein